MSDVLIVNDEQDLLAICQMVLEAEGHRVATVTRGMEAIRFIQRYRPHVLVLDWVLGDTTGDKVLLQIRKTEGIAGTPVVLMSALPDAASRAAELGANTFLPKPFDADRLIATVNGLLQRIRPAQAAQHA